MQTYNRFNSNHFKKLKNGKFTLRSSGYFDYRLGNRIFGLSRRRTYSYSVGDSHHCRFSSNHSGKESNLTSVRICLLLFDVYPKLCSRRGRIACPAIFAGSRTICIIWVYPDVENHLLGSFKTETKY